VIPLTAQNIAFIARTGTLEVASAGWQVLAWVIVGFFAAAYIALIVLTAVRRPRPQRPRPPAYGSQASIDAAHERLLQAERRFAGVLCLWCTPGNNFIDSTKCTCSEPCERGYCKARPVLRAVETVTEENR
jgi:hypothetical protein